MKIKILIPLMVTPLLLSCSGGDIDFNYETPDIGVESIVIDGLKRPDLNGEIASEGDDVFFDFYEVSDFHGAVNYDAEDKTIGLAKMADYFSKKREDNPGGTVVLSSGDMFQGSAESNLTRGYMVNYAMNVMGFEAMTLGNHEFDWSIDWLKKNHDLSVEDYKIPYLGANIYDKATNDILDFLVPSTIITRKDYKIGIVGTMGDGSSSSIMKSLVENLEFKPEFDIAKKEAKRLKEEEDCDIVVWSSHRDVNELSQLGLAKTNGIDVVFGGHTHENNPSDGESTTYIDGIPFLETKNYGKGIAHARVTLDKTTKEIKEVFGECDIEPYAYAGLEENLMVQKIMNAYNEKIEPIKSEVIGRTDAELDVSNNFTLTDLCVDTMSLVGKKWAKENGDVKILAAFHNANGGIRANIPAGDISFGSVYKSFPFDNEVVVVKVAGKKLKSFFNQGNMGMWRDTSVITKLTDLDALEEVYFVTTDFWAMNAFKLKENDLIRTNIICRDAIAARIKAHGNIKASDFDKSHEQFAAPAKR